MLGRWAWHRGMMVFRQLLADAPVHLHLHLVWHLHLLRVMRRHGCGRVPCTFTRPPTAASQTGPS